MVFVPERYSFPFSIVDPAFYLRHLSWKAGQNFSVFKLFENRNDQFELRYKNGIE